MLIRTVSTVVATDSTGRPVDALPVRTATANETDAAGRPVSAIPVTEDPNGVPVRFVVGKAAQNSAGQWADTIPVTGGGFPESVVIDGRTYFLLRDDDTSEPLTDDETNEPLYDEAA
jgi:hypothetical protein